MENLKSSVSSHIKTAQTPAGELRAVLSHLEAEIGKLGFGAQEEPVELLLAFDRADALLRQLADHDASFAGERGRFESLGQQYRRKGKRFLKAIGGRSGLQQARAAQPQTPHRDNWWWYIDDLLDEEQRTRRRKALRSLGITVASLLVVTVLYMLFLMPDEATRLRYRYEQDAEQALMAGDPARALPAVEEAMIHAPDNPELVTLRAVVLTLLDRQEEADAGFDEAREIFGDDVTFLATRAQSYMIANRPDLALEDAERVIEIDPTNGYAYFQLGNAQGSMGSFYEATLAYEKATELARLAGEVELEGMARVQLANLMMIMMSPPMPTGDATPTE